MNSQDLRALQEAYLDVYAPQELDEANKLETYRKATPRQRVGRRQDRDFGNVLHPSDYDTQGEPVRQKIHKDSRGMKKGMKTEEADLYDIILSHLLDEGYADNEQAAEAIMINMSEDWKHSIVESRTQELGDRLKNLQSRSQETDREAEKIKQKARKRFKQYDDAHTATQKAIRDYMKAG
jgi:hypothetical protein